MKLLFICGCLEAGKDGVGDYTSKLSDYCQIQGHEVSILAINDKYISATDDYDLKKPIVRLSRFIPWKQRQSLAIQFITAFKPNLISLQFVPYAFNPKGIIFNVNFFKSITEGFNTHIMFHELWIGEEIGVPLKTFLVGRIQKNRILSLIKKLNPVLIHTSIPLYQNILSYYGIKSQLLPLFGNISINKTTDFSWLYSEIKSQNGIEILSENKNEFLCIGIFGKIYQSVDLNPFLTQLEEFGMKLNKKLLFLSIGNSGEYGVTWIHRIKSEFPSIKFLQLGQRDEMNISTFLQFIDVGIAATPKIFLGKSGSYLAMKEHDLPILCKNIPNKYRFEVENDYFREKVYENVEEMDVLKNDNERHLQSMLPEVYQKYIYDIQSCL